MNSLWNKKYLLKKNCNKIFHLTRYFDKKKFGGIEEVIRQISFNSKLDHVVLSIGNSKRRKLNKNLFNYNFKKNFSLFGDIFSIDLFKFLMKEKENYNIIHVHYPYVFPLIYLFFLPFKKRIIVTHHSDIINFKYFSFFLSLFRVLINNYINYYHISSKIYFEKSEIKNYKNKTLIEPFCIRIPKKIKKKKIKFKKFILFISRHAHYKGFDKLKEIIARNPKINFVLITDNKELSKFKNVLNLSKISNNFKYSLIKQCVAIISTSVNRAESFGMSMLEGLMFSKPLIGFNIRSGMNDIIKDNYNGFLIKNYSIEEYSIKLNKVYFNDIEAKKMSQYSKIIKNKFNCRYKKLNKIYKKLNSI